MSWWCFIMWWADDYFIDAHYAEAPKMYDIIATLRRHCADILIKYFIATCSRFSSDSLLNGLFFIIFAFHEIDADEDWWFLLWLLFLFWCRAGFLLRVAIFQDYFFEMASFRCCDYSSFDFVDDYDYFRCRLITFSMSHFRRCRDFFI